MTPQVPASQIGTKDRSVGWYSPPITTISQPIRHLLENYANIPASEVIPRVIELRSILWDIQPLPCIGQFRFLNLSLSTSPYYPTILSRLISGGRLLDIGCCLATDLRKLIHDGAPSSSVYGLELEPEFISLSYSFFNDHSVLGGQLIAGDILDRNHTQLEELKGTFSCVQLNMVLHMFDLEGQIQVCERVVAMLKREKGVVVIGQSVGSLAGRAVPGRGSMIYKHDVGTFGNMWEEVGRRTGSRWVVRASLDEGLGIAEGRREWDEMETRRLVFEVERM
ncbi:hypothetical protein OQA88_8716 [Cercophora sp. LCS_1]